MLVDVSHTVEHGMITYKGLPAPFICDFLSREQSRSAYAPGTEFHIGKIEMVANTGTYLDSPFHRYANGKDLSQLPLERLANLEGIVIPVDHCRAIDRAALRDHDLRGKAVLIRTGWDANWRTDQYFEGHPFLTKDAAEYLVKAGVALVGIDSLNIDDTAGLSRPVHSALLAAEIPIVEHLRGLRQLPSDGFRFFAVPVKVKDFGTFPVRAFGLVERPTRSSDQPVKTTYLSLLSLRRHLRLIMLHPELHDPLDQLVGDRLVQGELKRRPALLQTA